MMKKKRKREGRNIFHTSQGFLQIYHKNEKHFEDGKLQMQKLCLRISDTCSHTLQMNVTDGSVTRKLQPRIRKGLLDVKTCDSFSCH